MDHSESVGQTLAEMHNAEASIDEASGLRDTPSDDGLLLSPWEIY